MQSSDEQVYRAIERTYGEGRFAEALAQALALQAQLKSGRSDQLDQRLQLLIGHIHLYGLAQPREAEAAYQAVLAGCSEPNYRQLAEQSLQLCSPTDQAEPSLPEAETQTINASATPADLPATPWLSQLQDPQQALTEIQAAWATAEPAAQPIAPALPEAPEPPATPWATSNTTALKAAEVAASPEPPEHSPEPEPPAETRPLPPEPPLDPAPQDAPIDEGARGELERGLLLVRLSSGVESGKPTPQDAAPAGAQEASNQASATAATVHVTAPSLGAAWTLFKRHWRS